MSRYATSSIAELERPDGWAPIRRHFGIRAFGVNAWTAHEPGEAIIPEHDEGFGQEELYLVTEGTAVFSLGGEHVDAPTGTIVHVPDPGLLRGAVAREAPATIVTVGATPGVAFTAKAWELNRDVLPLFDRGDYAGVKALLEPALEEYPDDPAPVLYNMACAEARLGEADAALGHLAEAVATDARYGAYARDDEDLASIRDDPRFPA